MLAAQSFFLLAYAVSPALQGEAYPSQVWSGYSTYIMACMYEGEKQTGVPFAHKAECLHVAGKGETSPAATIEPTAGGTAVTWPSSSDLHLMQLWVQVESWPEPGTPSGI
ncbi:hypothetical protein B0T21DRAFT_424117 [Apiosordaria backusii]|uniref:Uncharacterized protein n=1 Tax=Apiosordaria backusii TaxID=314023 RepID=A0AA40ASY2_9PEZI|nr:hypothetical protein B0T21DRAFT_424117 [Apiosordaria backusii]